jgi:hypothetical protein
MQAQQARRSARPAYLGSSSKAAANIRSWTVVRNNRIQKQDERRAARETLQECQQTRDRIRDIEAACGKTADGKRIVTDLSNACNGRIVPSSEYAGEKKHAFNNGLMRRLHEVCRVVPAMKSDADVAIAHGNEAEVNLTTSIKDVRSKLADALALAMLIVAKELPVKLVAYGSINTVVGNYYTLLTGYAASRKAQTAIRGENRQNRHSNKHYDYDSVTLQVDGGRSESFEINDLICILLYNMIEDTYCTATLHKFLAGSFKGMVVMGKINCMDRYHIGDDRLAWADIADPVRRAEHKMQSRSASDVSGERILHEAYAATARAHHQSFYSWTDITDLACQFFEEICVNDKTATAENAASLLTMLSTLRAKCEDYSEPTAATMTNARVTALPAEITSASGAKWKLAALVKAVSLATIQADEESKIEAPAYGTSAKGFAEATELGFLAIRGCQIDKARNALETVAGSRHALLFGGGKGGFPAALFASLADVPSRLSANIKRQYEGPHAKHCPSECRRSLQIVTRGITTSMPCPGAALDRVAHARIPATTRDREAMSRLVKEVDATLKAAGDTLQRAPFANCVLPFPVSYIPLSVCHRFTRPNHDMLILGRSDLDCIDKMSAGNGGVISEHMPHKACLLIDLIFSSQRRACQKVYDYAESFVRALPVYRAVMDAVNDLADHNARFEDPAHPDHIGWEMSNCYDLGWYWVLKAIANSPRAPRGDRTAVVLTEMPFDVASFIGGADLTVPLHVYDTCVTLFREEHAGKLLRWTIERTRIAAFAPIYHGGNGHRMTAIEIAKLRSAALRVIETYGPHPDWVAMARANGDTIVIASDVPDALSSSGRHSGGAKVINSRYDAAIKTINSAADNAARWTLSAADSDQHHCDAYRITISAHLNVVAPGTTSYMIGLMGSEAEHVCQCCHVFTNAEELLKHKPDCLALYMAALNTLGGEDAAVPIEDAVIVADRLAAQWARICDECDAQDCELHACDYDVRRIRRLAAAMQFLADVSDCSVLANVCSRVLAPMADRAISIKMRLPEWVDADDRNRMISRLRDDLRDAIKIQDARAEHLHALESIHKASAEHKAEIARAVAATQEIAKKIAPLRSVLESYDAMVGIRNDLWFRRDLLEAFYGPPSLARHGCTFGGCRSHGSNMPVIGKPTDDTFQRLYVRWATRHDVPDDFPPDAAAVERLCSMCFADLRTHIIKDEEYAGNRRFRELLTYAIVHVANTGANTPDERRARLFEHIAPRGHLCCTYPLIEDGEGAPKRTKCTAPFSSTVSPVVITAIERTSCYVDVSKFGRWDLLLARLRSAGAATCVAHARQLFRELEGCQAVKGHILPTVAAALKMPLFKQRTFGTTIHPQALTTERIYKNVHSYLSPVEHYKKPESWRKLNPEGAVATVAGLEEAILGKRMVRSSLVTDLLGRIIRSDRIVPVPLSMAGQPPPITRYQEVQRVQTALTANDTPFCRFKSVWNAVLCDARRQWQGTNTITTDWLRWFADEDNQYRRDTWNRLY